MAPKTTRQGLRPFHGLSAQARRLQERDEALQKYTRQEAFDRGYLTVKDLDDEELRHGRCRDQFGRIPKVDGKTELIPAEKFDEMVAEHELRFKQRLRERLDSMIDVMVGIAEDETVEPRDRLEAAKYIFERTAGKTPETVNVNVKAAPWEELFGSVAGIASMSREEHKQVQAGIIDVEFDVEGNCPGCNSEVPEDEWCEKCRLQDVDEDAGPSQGVPQDGEVAEADVEYVRQAGRADYGQDGADTDWTKPRDGYEGASTMARLDNKQHAGAPDEQLPEGARVPEQHAGYSERVPRGYVQTDIASTHDNEMTYGRKPDEERSYAAQARAAADLARRRKEARDARNAAKKARKIARAMGADAIKNEISGAEVDDSGTLRFET